MFQFERNLLHKYLKWGTREKTSHLRNRSETKCLKTNLFTYLCSYRSSIRVTMTGNINVYKTTWKNGNKEYNEKYICCSFTI